MQIPPLKGAGGCFPHKLYKLKKLIPILLTITLLSSCSKLSYKRAVKHAPYDAIIVTGNPFNGKKWSDVMKMRVYWSIILYKRGLTKNIIYSGSAVYTPYIEAEIMKQYAIKLGVPEDVIYTDTIAEHSTENLWYSCKLAKQVGFTKVALATDPFQSFAMKKFRKDNDLRIRFLPLVISEVHPYMSLKSPTIDPSLAFVKNFKSIEERESKWKRFKGTLGLNIEK